MEAKNKDKICVICRKKYEGYGNNPVPYKREGKCCDKCNLEHVIPARIVSLEKEREKMENDREFYTALLTLIDSVGERPVSINYEHKKIDFEDTSYFLYNEKEQFNFIHGDDEIQLTYQYSAFESD